jgi:membrane-associated phospholipid phosphatase
MVRDKLSDTRDLPRPDWRAVAIVATASFVLLVAVVATFDVAVPNRGLGVFSHLSVRTGVVLAITGFVTQFGDPWFLLLTATLVFLLGTERSLLEDPPEGAFVLAVTFGAFSLTDLLKNLYAVPRPPGAGTVTVPGWLPPALGGIFRSITTGTGYAFPSGHALGTAAVFAALAYSLKVGSPTARWSAAAVGISLVAVSRIVLGVHFFVDIVVGLVTGLTLFAVAATVGRRGPLRVFVLGAVLGVLAVAASAVSPAGEVWKAGQWLGASLGAGVAWYAVRPSSELGLRRTVLAGVPVAIIWIAIYVTSPPLVVTVVGTALAAGATILAPSVAERASGTG